MRNNTLIKSFHNFTKNLLLKKIKPFIINQKKVKNLFLVLACFCIFTSPTFPVETNTEIPNVVINLAEKYGYENPQIDIVWTDIQHGFLGYPEVYRVYKKEKHDKYRYILRNGNKARFSRLLDFYGPKVIIYL